MASYQLAVVFLIQGILLEDLCGESLGIVVLSAISLVNLAFVGFGIFSNILCIRVKA